MTLPPQLLLVVFTCIMTSNPGSPQFSSYRFILMLIFSCNHGSVHTSNDMNSPWEATIGDHDPAFVAIHGCAFVDLKGWLLACFEVLPCLLAPEKGAPGNSANVTFLGW